MVRRESEKFFALIYEWRYYKLSVPGGAPLDESPKRPPVETAASREVPVSSRLGSSLSWPTESLCAQ